MLNQEYSLSVFLSHAKAKSRTYTKPIKNQLDAQKNELFKLTLSIYSSLESPEMIKRLSR